MRISDWSSDVCSSDLVATAGATTRNLAIFDLGRDAGDGVGERIGRIPVDAHRFTRFARSDPRILELREPFDRVRKFIFELGRAQIAFTREDQRAAGALVISVAIGQEIAAIAIVGGDRTSVVQGKGVSVRVVLGGRRTLKKKKNITK